MPLGANGARGAQESTNVFPRIAKVVYGEVHGAYVGIDAFPLDVARGMYTVDLGYFRALSCGVQVP